MSAKSYAKSAAKRRKKQAFKGKVKEIRAQYFDGANHISPVNLRHYRAAVDKLKKEYGYLRG